MAAVDYAVEITGVSPGDWILRLMPDVIVVGGAAVPKDAARFENAGCSVMKIPLEPGYSTEALIERIQQIKQ
jgi:bifunctional ADP-heptose synthase (sugar kinase/adenylyltransferase)